MSYPKFIKYKEIPYIGELLKLLDKEVEIYEKLAGGNSQVRKFESRILAGNRSKFLKDSDRRFDWFQKFKKWALGNYSFYNLPENLVVYGEWLSKHTLDYYPEKMDRFYLIDVFDTNSRKFFPYEDSVDLLTKKNIGDIGFLTPLFKGKIELDALNELVKKKSDYRDGNMEGIVIKNYVSQDFAKLLESAVGHQGEMKRNLSHHEIIGTSMKLSELGINITKRNILKEVINELSRQRISYDKKRIEKDIQFFFIMQTK